MTGLSEAELEVLRGVFARFPQIEEVMLFGSRARGSHRTSSDVDLAIKGKNITIDTLARLRYILEEETNLPYFFDVVVYEKVENEEFRRAIEKGGKMIYSAFLTPERSVLTAEEDLMIIEKCISASAMFSNDKVYRYWLKRVWDEEKAIGVFICLNPSKATELKCDKTMCNINNLALQYNWGGFYILNLFAYIATNSSDMLRYKNPVGDNNDEIIKNICKSCNAVVLAWGEEKPRKISERAEAVKTILKGLNKNMYCLKQNKSSGYQHPCIIKVEDYQALEKLEL